MPRDPNILRHWRPEPPTKRELDALGKLESGDFEISRNKLELICWEAYQTFKRMGISPMIEAGDACTGIYTTQGDLAIGIMGTQLHLINASIGIKWMMRYYYEEPTVGIHEGDMFYANDPLYGGIHSPDQILFMPIFWEGNLIAWVATASHETETGAKEPGGQPPSAESRYDEGMILCPIKVAENYQFRADLIEMMENMVRDARMQTLDIKARATANQILERRIHDIIRKRGVDFLTAVLRRLIDEGVEAGHRKLAAMNDGIYRCTIFIDNAGKDKNGLIGCEVEVEKRGDRATIRFKGSPRVIAGNFNMFPHMMIAMFACYLFQFFFHELPPTTGYYEPFSFEFQDGSFFMADPEDATSLGVGTQAQVITAVHICMEKMKFSSPYHDQVVAPWAGTGNSVIFAGVGKDGTPYASWDQGINNGMGMGARWDQDGIDTGGFPWCAIGEFLDSELIEHQYPLLPIFRNVFTKDSAGMGKFRGGRSMNVMTKVHGVPEMVIVPFSGISGRPISPGLMGGYPARTVNVSIVKNSNIDELLASGKAPANLEQVIELVKGDWYVRHHNTGTEILHEGDLFMSQASAGPGFGDVLERDPQLVIEDVKDASISPRTAKEIYKLVYREDNFVVDKEATEEARQKERAARLARAKPYSEWLTSWLKRRPPERLLTMYGEWPNRMDTPLVDWEPRDELLDEHVREGGDPRPRPSRY